MLRKAIPLLIVAVGCGSPAVDGDDGDTSSGTATSSSPGDESDGTPKMDLAPPVDIQGPDCLLPPDGPSERTSWVRTVDLGAAEFPHDLAILASGEVLVVGGYVDGTYRGFLTAHDPDTGEASWSELADPESNWNSVLPTVDGGWVVGGSIDDDARVARFGSDGTPDWELVFDTPTGTSPPHDDSVRDLSVDSQGRIAALGASVYHPCCDEESSLIYWIFRISADGTLGPELWQGTTSFSVTTTSLDVVTAGRHENSGEVAVFALESGGGVMWETVMDEFWRNKNPGVIAGESGQVLWVGGGYEPAQSDESRATMGVLDANGMELWSKDVSYCQDNWVGLGSLTPQGWLLPQIVEAPGPVCWYTIRSFTPEGDELWTETVLREERECRGTQITVGDDAAFFYIWDAEGPEQDYRFGRVELHL